MAVKQVSSDVRCDGVGIVVSAGQVEGDLGEESHNQETEGATLAYILSRQMPLTPL